MSASPRCASAWPARTAAAAASPAATPTPRRWSRAKRPPTSAAPAARRPRKPSRPSWASTPARRSSMSPTSPAPAAAARPRTSFEYEGPADCVAAMRFGNRGPKACQFSCIGLGTCVKACQFGAMRIENGVAVVDREKCTSCMALRQRLPQGHHPEGPLRAARACRLPLQRQGRPDAQALRRPAASAA